jgi:hypothetical protein
MADQKARPSQDFTRSYTAWCRQCAHWEHLVSARTLESAMRIALKKGFQVVHGALLCEKCAIEARKLKSEIEPSG